MHINTHRHTYNIHAYSSSHLHISSQACVIANNLSSQSTVQIPASMKTWLTSKYKSSVASMSTHLCMMICPIILPCYFSQDYQCPTSTTPNKLLFQQCLYGRTPEISQTLGVVCADNLFLPIPCVCLCVCVCVFVCLCECLCVCMCVCKIQYCKEF